MVADYPLLFKLTLVDRASDSNTAADINLFASVIVSGDLSLVQPSLA